MRLKEWKEAPGDSFSRVVLKVVPERGTLGQMLDDVAKLPALSESQARVMEAAADYGADVTGTAEPWTS